MKRSTLRSTRVLVSAAALALSGSLQAGPLSPPSGPITSTMKPLDQVEARTPITSETCPGNSQCVFRITQPGSYYLTANITVPAPKSGIRIASPGVTIDLNGFEIIGQAGSWSGVEFENQAGSYPGTVVRNGKVRNCGGSGVHLFATGTRGTIIEQVVATGNGQVGIFVSDAGVLRHCSASQNLGGGFQAGTANNSVVEHCVAYGNDGSGFSIVGQGGLVRHCSAAENTGDGFTIGNGASIIDCIARGNDSVGIYLSNGSCVRNCTSSNNGLDGIRVSNDCQVVNNHCDNNGLGGEGAGIRLMSSDNRVEGNHCVDGDRGISAESVGNIIIGNRCSGNTVNWYIVAGNSLGPIVSAGNNAAIISGNSAPGTLGSSDPHANFTY
ncbi:MAG: right-handed parallel beta-helix repeat-containing protein [Phycisphaerales bacterium]|nr:right-handed parallel beta-helix repeat-containing protein [Phycisphaerales bacterium]